MGLIFTLLASPLPSEGPATACIPESLLAAEDSTFTPPDPAVRVRVTTPLGRTLLLTDTDTDEGLSGFRWRRRDYCLGYGFDGEDYFLVVNGPTRGGRSLTGTNGNLKAELTPDRWRESYGLGALYILVEPVP